MNNYYWLPSIKIRGYRPFEDILIRLKPLQILVGANGSGKSSLFEFLRFIRDACYQEIPPEIVEGTIGQQIFHKPGPDRLWWSAEIDLREKVPLYYQGELMGPVGSTKVIFERVITKKPLHDGSDKGYTFMNFKDGKGMRCTPLSRQKRGLFKVDDTDLPLLLVASACKSNRIR